MMRMAKALQVVTVFALALCAGCADFGSLANRVEEAEYRIESDRLCLNRLSKRIDILMRRLDGLEDSPYCMRCWNSRTTVKEVSE